MYEAIKNFSKQFKYEPVIVNIKKLKKYKRFVVLGMGGSNLVADLLKIRNPKLDIISHRNYGLPAWEPKVLKESLIIANSYSGNTEEVISGFIEAIKNKYPVAAVSIGGTLLELARKYGIPHIQMPDTGIQPRSALGFNIRAILKLMGDIKGLEEMKGLGMFLKSSESERIGKALAKKLKGRVPIIYSSLVNKGIAYNWKIKFNETAKIPAFINAFPELNHNEMTGFDAQNTTRALSKNFHFIFLKDNNDFPKIIKRMNITERMYRERGLPVEIMKLERENVFSKIFSSLLIADWVAYYLAEEYGVDAEQVLMVEEFKKLVKQ